MPAARAAGRRPRMAQQPPVRNHLQLGRAGLQLCTQLQGNLQKARVNRRAEEVPAKIRRIATLVHPEVVHHQELRRKHLGGPRNRRIQRRRLPHRAQGGVGPFEAQNDQPPDGNCESVG